tara:strand:+ start:359 stop:652 length:294 start_codon:yes stop_codon:yes gene_type:complete
MIEWDFISINDGNVGEVRTESKRKLIDPDSKFISGSPENSPSNSRRTCSDSSLELTSMSLRTKTPDAPAGIIQLKDSTIRITALRPENLRKLIILFP